MSRNSSEANCRNAVFVGLSMLSPREREFISKLYGIGRDDDANQDQGKTLGEIAADFGITEHLAEAELTTILRKLRTLEHDGSREPEKNERPSKQINDDQWGEDSWAATCVVNLHHQSSRTTASVARLRAFPIC